MTASATWRRRVDALCDAFETEGRRDPSARVGPAHLGEADGDTQFRLILLEELLKVERELRRERDEEPSPAEAFGRFPDPADAPAIRRAYRDAFAGPYELLTTLGEGGMGEVLHARRSDRPGEDYALKRLKLFDSAAVRRFLEVEIPVARSLRHPGIVQVLEAGADGEGRPYYVMPLIQGHDLAWMIREGGPLTGPRAAALVAQAARAIDSAHTQGVLHRDIKPRNLLVQPGDEVVVLDFGLAKVLGRDFSASESRAQLGTYPYMAPEQIADSKRVGIGADIYSLGITLYECICGQTPFPFDPVEADVASLLHRIVNEPPPRPRTLAHGISRTLETIILACLEKRPEDRYPTAQALAEDLERFTRNERISWKRPDLLTRVSRWARAYPAAAGLIVTGTAAVIAGAFVFQQWRANQDLRLEQGRLRQAEKAVRRAIDTFGALALRHGVRPQELEPVIRTMEAGDQGDHRISAWSQSRLARLFDVDGQRREALKLHRSALAIRRELAAESPNDLDLIAELAESHHDLGVLQQDLGDLEPAEASYQRALELRGRLIEERPDDPAALVDLGRSQGYLGDLMVDLGNDNAALKHYQESLALRRRLHDGANGQDAEYAFQLARGHRNLMRLALTSGDRAEGKEQAEQSRQLLRPWLDQGRSAIEASLRRRGDAAGYDLEAYDFERDMAVTLNGLGEATEDPDRARDAFAEALRLSEQLTADRPQVAKFALERARSMAFLADAERRLGKGEAGPHAEEAMRLYDALAKDNPDDIGAAIGQAWSRALIALLKKPVDRAALEKARDDLEAVERRTPLDQELRRRLRDVRGWLADLSDR